MKRKYMVTVTRCGGAIVMAESEEEAMRIVDEGMKTDDISWDDDWLPTDASPMDEE